MSCSKGTAQRWQETVEAPEEHRTRLFREDRGVLWQAVRAIETIASKLTTPSLRQSFLGADPVVEVYRALGRRPPFSAA